MEGNAFWFKECNMHFFGIMAKVFKDWIDQFLKVFVDDINIHNNDWKDHLDHMKMVFERMWDVNLKLNLGKCCFGAKEITFLRHVVN
jgi:hypothetical protein